jgi:hypothetical protein
MTAMPFGATCADQGATFGWPHPFLLTIMSRSSKEQAAPTSIRLADDLIEQATLHLAAMDRELAALQRRARRGATKALREQMATVRVERDLARMELLELVELAELPGRADGLGLN